MSSGHQPNPNLTYQQFIEQYAPYANLLSMQTGIPSRVWMAKFDAETSHGTHFSNNNIGGIKAGSLEQNDGFSPSAPTATREDNGGSHTERARFISFPDEYTGISGIAPFLNQSTVPSMQALANLPYGGIFAKDPAAEAAAMDALNNSPYSTQADIRQTLPGYLNRVPDDLSVYGISPTGNRSTDLLAQFAPYAGASGSTDFSQGLGPFNSMDYASREAFDTRINGKDNNLAGAYQTQFLPSGRVLPRQPYGPTGLTLPEEVGSFSPRGSMGDILAGAPPSGGGPLNDFSDAITSGLESFGGAARDAFLGAGNALNQGLGNLFGGGPAQAAAFNPNVGAYAFGGNPVGNAFGVGRSSFNSGFLTLPLPPSFYAPGGDIQTPDPISGAFGMPQAQGVDTSNLFGVSGPQAAPSYGAPDLAGMFGGGAGIFNGGGSYSPGGFYGGRGAFNIGGFGAVPQFGGMPSIDAGTLGPGQTAGTLGPDQSADPFGAGATGLPLGLGGQAVQPYGFNGFNARGIFNGSNALPFGFGGTLAPTLGFNGTDAATFGPDQSVTAMGPAASAPGPFGFGGLNFGGGLGAGAQGFGDLYGVGASAAPAAPAPAAFGFSGGNFGAGLGAQAQSFGGLYGMPSAPAAPAYNPFGGGIGGFGGFGGGFDVGGGLGATPQSFGSLYGAPAAPVSPAAPALGPYAFGGDVSGFDPNAGGAPTAPAPPSGSLGGADLFGSSGFDPQASENAYLRGQMADNYAKMTAGQSPAATNPNVYNQQFAAMAPPAPSPQSFIAQQPAYAPAPGFSAPVSYAAPQIALQMAVPSINIAPPLMSGGGFGVGFL